MMRLAILAVLAVPASTQVGLDLRPYVVPIRHIAMDSGPESFADLEPLVAAIGTSRIVVLGEATHGEGTASRAKARLVRFLHARMGFDVLAWETGFLQAHAMNGALADPSVPIDRAAAYLMSGGWATDTDVLDLLEYARATTQTLRPLRMAGFDTGRPARAAPAFLAMLDEVTQRAPWMDPSAADRATLTALARRAFGFLSSERTPDSVRTAQRAPVEHLRHQVDTERARLRQVLSDRELAWWTATLDHLLASELLKEARGVEFALGRDSTMATMVRRLADDLYPGQKIIIWAATAHFIRNSTAIRNRERSDMYTMNYQAGDHLAPVYGNDLYTIAVTSWGGVVGEVFPEGAQFPTQLDTVVPAPPESIEGVMHNLGMPYAFLNLRGLPDNHPWRGPQVSVALGRFVNTAPWSRVVDAFLFIDRAEPVRHRGRDNPRRP